MKPKLKQQLHESSIVFIRVLETSLANSCELLRGTLFVFTMPFVYYFNLKKSPFQIYKNLKNVHWQRGSFTGLLGPAM